MFSIIVLWIPHALFFQSVIPSSSFLHSSPGVSSWRLLLSFLFLYQVLVGKLKTCSSASFLFDMAAVQHEIVFVPCFAFLLFICLVPPCCGMVCKGPVRQLPVRSSQNLEKKNCNTEHKFTNTSTTNSATHTTRRHKTTQNKTTRRETITDNDNNDNGDREKQEKNGIRKMREREWESKQDSDRRRSERRKKKRVKNEIETTNLARHEKRGQIRRDIGSKSRVLLCW